uniref:RagB/SusD domain-containing protein n=1 Tax=Sphingobacterium sp. (strain 21) TaxID=743722 RepID=F4CAN5_SPHS2
MNNKKYKTLKQGIQSIMITVLCFISCSEQEYLHPDPTTYIPQEQTFDTPERVLALVNGLYRGMKDQQFYGGRYYIYCEVRGEEYINRTANLFTAFDSWNHTLNAGSNEVQNLWAAAYRTINLCNVFLQGLVDNADKVDSEAATAYAAEAKFVRAVSYFALVTLYARPYIENNGNAPGLPLRLLAETSSANNSLARSTVAEVYAQILKDLDEAETGLPLSYDTPLLNTTRAHRNTAIAFKTRVYLTMGNYSMVIQEAQKIVSANAPYRAETGVAHALQDDATIPFLSNNYTTTESIFSMPMTDLDSTTGQSSIGYNLNTSPGNSEYNLNPLGIIADTEWRENDQRRLFITGGATKYLKKYSKPSPFLDYIPVIRYAEVLLNYAEAAAHVEDLDKARDLLTYVRNRADASYQFPTSAINNVDALIQTILHERRIEFLGEGLRSNDLLRTLQTIPAKGTAPAVSPTEEAYIFPLPNSELLTNKDL